jgi:hypothetical protein
MQKLTQMLMTGFHVYFTPGKAGEYTHIRVTRRDQRENNSHWTGNVKTKNLEAQLPELLDKAAEEIGKADARNKAVKEVTA